MKALLSHRIIIKPIVDVNAKSEFLGSSMFQVKNGELVVKKSKNNAHNTPFQTMQTVEQLSVFESNTNVCTAEMVDVIGNEEKKITAKYKLNAKKIKRRLGAWFRTKQAKKYLYFVTISFPFGVSDDLAFRYFNIWLTKLRKDKIIRSYLWVTERQQNGTIHYHMLVDRFFSVVAANHMMRVTLVNAYAKNTQIFNGYNPDGYNGVDIAKDRVTRKVINFAADSTKKAIASYITKYITKNKEEYTHFAWHCSRDVSNYFSYAVAELSEQELAAILKQGIEKTIKTETATIYIMSYDIENKFIYRLNEFNNLISDSMT